MRAIGLLGFVSGILLLVTSPVTAFENPFKKDIALPGNQAYQQNDLSKAAAEYIKAQDQEPLSAELEFNLGAVRFKENNFAEAITQFEKATRADDKALASSAYYNLGNSRYKLARQEFEAATVNPEAPEAQAAVQTYVKKLEECIGSYEEGLKRNPADGDGKYNIEMIRREIKNLARRTPPEDQQQQQQKQDNKDQEQKDQENKDQQQKQDQKDQNQKSKEQSADENKDQQQSEQQEDGKQPTPAEQGTPTPQPAAQKPEPTQSSSQPEPTESGQSAAQVSQATGEKPPEDQAISQIYARQLLENLPEQRQRLRPGQRARVEKDW